MRIGDIVICVASIAVIFALIAVPLELLFVSVLGLEPGYDVGVFVAIFLSALVSGYIFAGKLWEARRESIAKITVVWTALVIVIAANIPAAVEDWGPKVKAEYLAANPGATLSTSEWVYWEMMYVDIFIFITIALTLVLSLIGLYVGSMLKKPVK